MAGDNQVTFRLTDPQAVQRLEEQARLYGRSRHDHARMLVLKALAEGEDQARREQEFDRLHRQLVEVLSLLEPLASTQAAVQTQDRLLREIAHGLTEALSRQATIYQDVCRRLDAAAQHDAAATGQSRDATRELAQRVGELRQASDHLIQLATATSAQVDAEPLRRFVAGEFTRLRSELEGQLTVERQRHERTAKVLEKLGQETLQLREALANAVAALLVRSGESVEQATTWVTERILK